MIQLRAVLSSFTIVALASLAACGGGGGGDSSGGGGTGGGTSGPTQYPQPTAAAPALTTIATSGNVNLTRVPATYASGSIAAQAFAALDDARVGAGIGIVTQSTMLDAIALGHAAYWSALVADTTLTTTQQTAAAALGLTGESTALEPSLYSGDTPQARAVRAGVIPAGYFSTETMTLATGATTTSGANCVSAALNTVYGADALLSPATLVGIAQGRNAAGKATCFFDLAQPTANGAVPASGTTIVNPAPGTTAPGTYAIGNEVPRPASTQITAAAVGTPVMYNARSADWINASIAGTLAPAVNAFTISNSSGTAVPAIILASSSFTGSGTYPDARLNAGTVVLIPTQPLVAGTYSVHIAVSLTTGTVQTKDWTFVAQ